MSADQVLALLEYARRVKDQRLALDCRAVLESPDGFAVGARRRVALALRVCPVSA